MSHTQALHYLWWLVSRASGIVALVLITLSVAIGLAMAGRVLRSPKLKRAAIRLHEHCAVTALAAIALHGLALLGDKWLKPGWRGIAVPFAIGYRPGWVAAGIFAGYLAALIGPSFYVRRRIGAKRWRKLHRLAIVVWALSAAHALGAGSDAHKLWLRLVVLSPAPLIAYLLAVRTLGARRAGAARAPAGGRAGSPPTQAGPAHQKSRGSTERSTLGSREVSLDTST